MNTVMMRRAVNFSGQQARARVRKAKATSGCVVCIKVSRAGGIFWAAENRLVDVSRDGVSIASFVYARPEPKVKGWRRVTGKAMVEGVTTVHIGNYYEWSIWPGLCTPKLRLI